jgi:hypothetical protein
LYQLTMFYNVLENLLVELVWKAAVAYHPQMLKR